LKSQTVDTALAIFDAEQPDIIISDIGMPEKDGYALVREIKERSGGKIPIVALTAYAGENDNQRALQAGFHAYLPKPLDPSELIEMIARLSPK
jgi:CheY-like chemotaxis protein